MSTTLRITGMTCQNCVRHAMEALQRVPGVVHVRVDLADGTADVDGDAAIDALVGALEEEGYEAAPM